MASRALGGVVAHPAAWPTVVVHKLTAAAEQFLAEVGADDVELAACGNVHRVEWFLEGLIARGMHTVVESLRICLGKTGLSTTCTLMHAVAEFTALEDLDIECEGLPRSACLAFPSTFGGLTRLERLRVTERAADRRLEVYLGDACLPQLREVRLRVCTSDVLAQAHRLRNLHVVSYDCTRETFEDARLDNLRLELLSATAPTCDAADTLLTEVSNARRIGTLALTCPSVTLDAFMPVDCLHIKVVDPGAEVSILHPAVRFMEAVTVEHMGDAPEGWSVRFTAAGSWHNFQTWLARTVLRVGHDGSVSVHT